MSNFSSPTVLSIGAVARHFGCAAWQVRRLFERDLLPAAPRIGRYRVVATSDLPLVQQALHQAGYLPGLPTTRPAPRLE
jgi:hypothetical protein